MTMKRGKWALIELEKNESGEVFHIDKLQWWCSFEFWYLYSVLDFNFNFFFSLISLALSASQVFVGFKITFNFNGEMSVVDVSPFNERARDNYFLVYFYISN